MDALTRCTELWGRLWANRFLRFLLVGGVNTVFGYSVFTVCFLLSGRHDLALIFSVCIGVIFNFFAIGGVVFRTLPKERFLLFCINYAAAFAVNYAMLGALVAAGLWAPLAQAICLPVFVLVSYALNARFVFRAANADAGRPAGPSTHQP